MDIQLPLVNLLPQRPEIRGIASLLAQLTPGQQIDAVVETHIGENYYLLRLNDSGLQLRARTPLALETGRTLTLQVVESGDSPRLKVVAPPPAPAPAEPSESQVIQQAVREFLPKRQPTAELATALERLLQPAPGEPPAKLPEPVRAAVAHLAEALPQPGRLADARGLQEAVRDSGLFLEAKLAAAPGAAREWVAADVKGRLLMLVDTVRKQLQELDTSGDGPPQELADLPEDYRPRAGPAAPVTGERLPARQPMAESAAQPVPSKLPAEALDVAAELRLAGAPAESPPPGPPRTGGAAPAGPAETVPARAELPRQDAPAPEPGRELRQQDAATTVVPRTAAAQPDAPPSPATQGLAPAAEPNAPQVPARPPAQPGGGDPMAAKPSPGAAAEADTVVPQDGKSPEMPAEPVVPGAKTAAFQPSPQSPAQTQAPSQTQIPPQAQVPAQPPAPPAVDSARPLPLVGILKNLLGLDVTTEPVTLPLPVDAPQETPAEPAPMPAPALPRETEEPAPHKPPQLPAAPPLPAALPGATGGAVQVSSAELKALLHKAEGALAGIVMDQLASLPQGDGRQAVWQLEIPYVLDDRGDALKLKVVREGKRGAPPLQCFWSVTLELHPPGLGTINARISLSGGNIDSYFWSDRPATAQAIQSHLDLLAARLGQAGLSVGRLGTLPSAPAGSADSGPPAGTLLLDERV